MSKYVNRRPPKVPSEAHIQNLIWLRALPKCDDGNHSSIKSIRRADAAVNKHCRETGNEKTNPLDQIREIQRFR